MKKDESFKDYIVYDILSSFENITIKRMFSGWGIFWHGVIVGFVANGEFYTKGNKAIRLRLEQEGSHPFTYEKTTGKTYEMMYFSVPEEIFENPEKMRERLEEAFEISKLK